ncbi:DUF1983 domain-containing protein [Aeromonas veronii]
MTTGKATFRASNSPQGLTENMQILTGQKGDRLDKALTLREAVALGMVNLRRNGSGQIVPELPPATSGDPEWSGVQQPVAPTGVTVDGAFHAVTLTWDAPAYNGHAFAEVWRAQENDLAKAVRVGTTLANVYSDAVGKGFKAFYWVRFVNKNAFAGPYQSTGGIPAETSRDVQDVLDAIKGKIENSHLAKELLDPIQQVPQLGERITIEALELGERITEETQARASADQALSTQISTVSAKANGLDAALQVQGRAVSDLQNGAQAMWSIKAQAGDIKAGIGLVAKSDGTSQVMVSASQFFVFNPNSPSATAPLFAIDNGQTVIAEAIIRKATIQIIHSEKITADYIKAGVSISAPLITGGQFDMGNAFMSGGAAGFGKGGPYGGWGWGWHTIIYSDGSLYTNRLNAEGGYVRNMTIGNCTIDQNCIVHGTIFADRIVGDVTKMFTHKGAFTIPAYNRARNLVLVQGGITFSRRVSGSGTIGLNLHVYLNGSLVETITTTTNLPTGGDVNLAVTVMPFMVIPANTDATISFATSAYGNGSLTGPENNITSRAVWLMALT